MKTDHVSIIGGGIAGLASAIAVAKANRSVAVYEKSKAFDPVGAGLQLGPNAVRALKKLDIWDHVKPFTSSPPAIHIRDGKSGKILKEIKLDSKFEARFGEPYRVAHRADLHQALLKAATKSNSIKIHLGEELAIADWRSSGSVIGADGIWSASRENFFPDSSAIISTDTIYRSLEPLHNVTGIAMECVNLWLFPGGHVVHYPAGKDAKLNLVVVTQGKLPLHHFANASPQLVQLLQQSKTWTNWPAAYVRPLDTWSVGPHALLIGDAAHGTLPYLAQGAAMALEDAAELFKQLENETRSQNAFTAFEIARIARTTKLHNASLEAGKMYHMGGAIAALRNLIIQAAPSHLIINRMKWTYDTN
jgi:salicylate hydroxylase